MLVICFLLMMTKTIFSQVVMEIYAYNYISQCQVEKNSRENIIKQKREKPETENKVAKEKQIQETNAYDKTRSNTEKSEAFSFIVPIDGGITSSVFGDIVDRTSIHKGHDWAVPSGTDVKASEKGVVELAYYSDSYGYNVLIRHNETLETRYAHMSVLYVKQGDSVAQGQILGLSGSTGDSTGPHLHFEVIKSGIKINPLSILD